MYNYMNKLFIANNISIFSPAYVEYVIYNGTA